MAAAPPRAWRPWRCSTCSATFSPLVYQTGQVTVAEHYHADEGGIYFLVTTGGHDVSLLAETSGFAACLQPIGRDEAMLCTQIHTYCMHRTHPNGLQELREGVLLKGPTGRRDLHIMACVPGNLLPLYGPEELDPGEHAPFRFHVRGATVSLSRPAPP